MVKNDDATVDDLDAHGARLRIPRSRGAFSGLMLLLLGAWGALAPLLGPYVHAGYTPDSAWQLSSGRFWLEILPGAVTALGGLLLLVGANRITTSFGGWLAVAGGAWFVVGPSLRLLLHLGSIGTPIHTSRLGAALETLLLFNGLGALILFLAATAVGRLAIVGIRDVRAAHRRAVENAPPERTIRETPAEPVRVVPVPVAEPRVERTRVVEAPAVETNRYPTAVARDDNEGGGRDGNGGTNDGADHPTDSNRSGDTGQTPEPPAHGGGATRLGH